MRHVFFLIVMSSLLIAYDRCAYGDLTWAHLGWVAFSGGAAAGLSNYVLYPAWQKLIRRLRPDTPTENPPVS